MRFLHLADLHLGKSMYGTSLTESGDQRVWTERFLETAFRLKPDAVVIAGDVYDRGLAPGSAVQLLSGMVTALAEKDIPVFMTAGNHDSISHLSFLSPLLQNQKVFISRPPDAGGGLTHATLEDEHGSVTFWLMPYVFPAMIAQALADEEIRDYDTAVRRILAAQKADFTRRNVLIAHQNVTANGQEVARGGSESMVGGVGQVDYTAFDGFDYVALGHIHSSYFVGRETVRYAGSPLAYHFNETKQPAKGPLLVTMGEKGAPVKIERQEIPPMHRMREIRDGYDAIREQAAREEWQDEYLKIILTDRRITPEISDYLHETARARGSTVMELTSEYSEFTGEAEVSGTEDVHEKPVEELFADFYRDRSGGIEADEKDRALLAFTGEMTRRATEGTTEPDETEFRKILEFALGQEGETR